MRRQVDVRPFLFRHPHFGGAQSSERRVYKPLPPGKLDELAKPESRPATIVDKAQDAALPFP